MSLFETVLAIKNSIIILLYFDPPLSCHVCMTSDNSDTTKRLVGVFDIEMYLGIIYFRSPQDEV